MPEVSDHRLAAALAGATGALEALAFEDEDGALARRHRIGPALYFAASAGGIEGPGVAAWRRDMASIAAHYMVLDAALVRIAAVLAAVGVDWIPIKGYDLASRVYARAEERVTSDLDLLIAAADLEGGRRALRADGWEDVSPGPLARRYLREEGYAWQAVGANGVLLELHFRLWGSVPEGLAAEMTEASTADAALPAGGRRLTPHHAYLAAAAHLWLSPPPRAVGSWRDLERLAATVPDLADEVVATARRWDLQLPVALASEVAAQLWGDATCRRIATELEGDLQPPERLALAAARRRDPARASLASLALARLVAGRRSRHGWRTVWRRLWAHPGLVETTTSPRRPWFLRRLAYQLSAFGWSQPARWIEPQNAPEPAPASGDAVERGIEP